MTDQQDPAIEAALRILEAQFDVLDQNTLELDEDQTSRLLAAAEHLFLITRLALIKNRLEREGIWRKHALPPLEDPDDIYFVGSDGVRYAIFVDKTPHPLITELLETSSTRYFEGASSAQEDIFENLMPANHDRAALDAYGTTEAPSFPFPGPMYNAAIDHVAPSYDPPQIAPAPPESIWAMEASMREGVDAIVESFKDGIMIAVGGSSQGTTPPSEEMYHKGYINPDPVLSPPLSEPFRMEGYPPGFDARRLDG